MLQAYRLVPNTILGHLSITIQAPTLTILQKQPPIIQIRNTPLTTNQPRKLPHFQQVLLAQTIYRLAGQLETEQGGLFWQKRARQ